MLLKTFVGMGKKWKDLNISTKFEVISAYEKSS
jgi:hypothetical protein